MSASYHELQRAMKTIVSICYSRGTPAARLNQVWTIAETVLQENREEDKPAELTPARSGD